MQTATATTAGTPAADVRIRTWTVLAVLAVLLPLGALPLVFSDRDVADEAATLPPLLPAEIHPGLDYSLDAAAASRTAPRLFLDSLEYDLARIRDATLRKQTFFRIVLPIVAAENDRLRAQRQSILDDPAGVKAGLYAAYGVRPGDVEALLRRVDVIPASLVLAQAAVESGWGSSRFARHGNNLFGIRSYNKDVTGIAPKEATGFKVVAYPSLAAGVRSYMRTLNTHPAYAELRRARAAMRAAGGPVRGAPLAAHLGRYSEVPERYGRTLRAVMDANGLGRFDGIRLGS